MARYGWTAAQVLTLETTAADRQRTKSQWPKILHHCDGLAFAYNGQYDEWSWDEEDTWHYANFCPRCGVDLRALIPKE